MWVSRRMRIASQQFERSPNSEFLMIPKPPAVLRADSSNMQTPRLVVPITEKNRINPDWLASPCAPLNDVISAKVREKFEKQPDMIPHYLHEINGDLFWTKHCSLQELSRLEDKHEILRVISTFEFISKKSVFLFSTYSRKILANAREYSAGQLADVIHSFAHLGFLEESFCMQLADRLKADMHTVTHQQFVHIADGFASTRCYLSQLVDAIIFQIPSRAHDLETHQVSLLLSSLARLNVLNESVFAQLGHRLISLENFTARDVTLTAYAFAKMRVPPSLQLEEKIVDLSKNLVRDFTAKELQMLSTALDKWNIAEMELFQSISAQAQRRIAQFSSESLVHLLRALLGRNCLDDQLMSRVVCQLPRLANNMQINEIVLLLAIFRDANFSSPVAIEAVRPSLVTKVGLLTPADWTTVLDCLSKIASQDALSEILEAFVLVNRLPPLYRNTTNQVSASILQRMSVTQLISTLNSARKHPEAAKLVCDTLRAKTATSENASDAYCALVELNLHQEPTAESLMRHLLSLAISN